MIGTIEILLILGAVAPSLLIYAIASVKLAQYLRAAILEFDAVSRAIAARLFQKTAEWSGMEVRMRESHQVLALQGELAQAQQQIEFLRTERDTLKKQLDGIIATRA